MTRVRILTPIKKESPSPSFFPESEQTGPPVGGRPHSTARVREGACVAGSGGSAMTLMDDVAELLTKCLIQAN